MLLYFLNFNPFKNIGSLLINFIEKIYIKHFEKCIRNLILKENSLYVCTYVYNKCGNQLKKHKITKKNITIIF
jgi:hypothetical protein